jgi:crotonobetainyl-CoA:carnitine CoA-transferase CaiB-like acyl-CoA transferase
MGAPLVFSESPTRDPGRPPLLGEHTDATLRDLGYAPEAIEDLRHRRVIGGPPA